MTIYIDEFLYRGRGLGSAEPPAWHLMLAAEGEDPFGRPMRQQRMLTMAQAQAEGWDLPETIAAINAAALAECEALRAAVAAKDAEIESLTAALAAATAGGAE